VTKLRRFTHVLNDEAEPPPSSLEALLDRTRPTHVGDSKTKCPVPNTAAYGQTPKIAMEELMLPAGDAGIELYVRNKRPMATCPRSARRAPEISDFLGFQSRVIALARITISS